MCSGAGCGSSAGPGGAAGRPGAAAPAGSSRRISYGILNLPHRHGSADPRPLVPGEVAEAWITLKMCGHRVPAGHRLRLAVSTALWPLVWPAPDATTLTLLSGGCRLMFPVRRGAGSDVRFDPPRHGPAARTTVLAEGRTARCVTVDLEAGTATVVAEAEGGLFGEGALRFDDIGTKLSHDLTRTLTVGRDPLSAETRIVQRYSMGREGWRIRIETEAAMRGDAEAFTVEGELRAYEGDALVRTRTWRERIPRREL